VRTFHAQIPSCPDSSFLCLTPAALQLHKHLSVKKTCLIARVVSCLQKNNFRV